METAFQNVLTASFHGSIVILAVAALRFILPKAPKKYVCMLWLLAVIRLLMPFRLESSLSLQPDLAPVQVISAGTQWTAPQDLPPAAPGTPSRENITVEHRETPNFAPAEQTAPEPLPAEVPAAPTVNWRALIPWLWLGVALAFGLYTLRGYLRLKRKVRFAVKIPGGWECEGIETAFILGYIKPKIYIPMGLPRGSRKYILAHERTHLEKGDHWLKLIAFLTLALHWFNPLVWLMYVLLCRDMEMACDERVIRFMELEERKAYSNALLTCSASRAHYAACPIAFGEVNVKQRILSVLNYRKPGFWVTLLSVLAVAAVAVTLLTSPREEPPVPGGDNQLAAETTAASAETGYLTGLGELSDREMTDLCQQALNEVYNGESYCAKVDFTYYVDSKRTVGSSGVSIFRKSGENSYIEDLGPEGEVSFASLEYEGQTARNLGSGILIWQEQNGLDMNWVQYVGPQGKMVDFPEGMGIVDPNTIRFHAVWYGSNWESEVEYEGDFTFTFREDGSLKQATADWIPDDLSNGRSARRYVVTVREETPEDIAGYIQNAAANAMTQEEYDRWYWQMQTITEVPSNKTTYDTDFMLGAGSKQWQFFRERGHVRIAAEDVTETGLTLRYSEAGDNHTSLTADEGFWLEQLVDGVWTVIAEYGAPAEAIQVSWNAVDQTDLSWDTPLEGGFYRLGRYHTMVLEGQTETAVCYAKFRLYGEEKQWIEQARAAYNALLTGESYHLYCVQWNTEHTDMEYYLTTEAWKYKDDYLTDTRYVDRLDPAKLHGRRGALRRDRACYELEWAGDTVQSPLASWSANTYMTDSNFTLWSFPLEWYDARVEAVFLRGNVITIQEYYDFSDQYEATQIELTLNDSGKIQRIRRLYLPTRDCSEEEKTVDVEVTVFDDAAYENAQVILGQDLTEIPAFSWEADQKRYPVGSDDVRSMNFVNRYYEKMNGTQAVISRALGDCTLPANAGLEPGINESKVYFDPAAKVWKVEFTASWDSTVYQAVYLNEQGQTLLSVTLKLDPIGG